MLDPATDTHSADWYAIIVRNKGRKVNPPLKLVIRTTVPYAPRFTSLLDEADWYDWSSMADLPKAKKYNNIKVALLDGTLIC
uniref:Uncharacterized protein n=1 Tax=Thermogemmatispora argillosa TaxID=2045280 RepID=A0A455T4M5_9CHLR|nr:hypothetical protein KTA_31370 [Thermogemmatispora argillosa]